jgi:osmotically-inducible protein OsmY
MADNNRNQSDNRFSSQEWDNDYNREQRNWEERYQSGNQGSSQNRGNRNRQNDDNNSGSGGWNRDEGNWQNRGGSGRMSSDYSSGGYGSSAYGSGGSNMGSGQDRNYGYGGREYGSSYGGGGYQGNSSYYDSGSYGNSGRASYGNSRNLYDRDYERFDRDRNSNKYTGLGASNYGGGYEDRGRRSYDENPYYGSTNPQNYQGNTGSSYGGNYYGRDYGSNRGYGQGDSNDRSWWDRTKDEVSSWFGDEEAERRRNRDQQMNFRGKGPRNYTRSDDRIKEDINDRLSDDSWVDASDIDVQVNKCEVILTGNVNDRSAKRRAEDIAESVSGVKHVENRIRVNRETSSAGSGPSSGDSSASTDAKTGGAYASSETSASQTGVTGSGATTGSSEKEKSKNKYVTG